jgi:hypothetical protein
MNQRAIITGLTKAIFGHDKLLTGEEVERRIMALRQCDDREACWWFLGLTTSGAIQRSFSGLYADCTK